MEGGKEVPKMHGPKQPHEEPHFLQGSLQIDSATIRSIIKVKRGIWGRSVKRETFVTTMMNFPLELIIKGKLMRDAPKVQGSTFIIALLHPLKVVVALMDDFQRKVESRLHL